jgi:hypothetical protein
VTKRLGRRRKQLLVDLKETKRYWKLTDEALDRNIWRTGFGSGYGLVGGYVVVVVVVVVVDDDDDCTPRSGFKGLKHSHYFVFVDCVTMLSVSKLCSVECLAYW